MGELMQSFWQEEDGLGTVEMVLLLAALVAVAVMFTNAVKSWVENQLKTILPE